MMKKSKWIRGSAAAWLLLGLAGCGSDSGDSNANTGAGTGGTGTVTAGTTAPAAGTAAPAPAGTGGGAGAAGSKPATAGTGASGTGAAGTSSGTAGSGGSATAGTGAATAGTGGAGGAAGATAGTGAAAGSGGSGGGAPTAGTGGGTLGGPLMYTGPFTMGMTIDPKYKCPSSFGGGTGENKSPPLAWKGGPADTKSFAVVLFDTRYMMLHWVIWDIPATVNMLPEAIPSGYEIMNPMGAHQASQMGQDRKAYYGPCSSGAAAGTYEYRLYALKVDKLGLTESSTAMQAQMAVESMMLEKTVWTGKPM